MAERQAHGFRFESAVKEVLGVSDTKGYTAAFDIGEDISVKFIGKGTVDMGSVVRIFEHCLKPGWKMVLGRHSGNKVCSAVYELDFDEEVCSRLMGALSLEDVASFDAKVKSFPEGEHDAARKYAKAWKAEHKHKMGLLTIQPKIDSKSQRRVQCGINNTNLQKLFSLVPSDTFASLIGENFAN